MQVDRHNILWHRKVMLVQWALVIGWLTVFGLLGGHWYSLHFECDSPPLLSVLIVGLWRMPSAVCQNWGNVRRSNNASVLCSVKWWKRPIITGIIKTVRGSSVDGFVYCLLLLQHHKLLGLHFLALGLRHQKSIATVPVCASNKVKVRVRRWVVLGGATLTVWSAYVGKTHKDAFIFSVWGLVLELNGSYKDKGKGNPA